MREQVYAKILRNEAATAQRLHDSIRLQAESANSFERALLITPWNKQIEYLTASTYRYLAEWLLRDGRDEQAVEALAHSRKHLAALLRVVPQGNATYHRLDANLHRIAARISSFRGDIAESQNHLERGYQAFLSAELPPSALAQHEFQRLQKERTTLRSGDIPPEYERPRGTRTYDPASMRTVGSWGPNDCSTSWHTLEWPCSAVGDAYRTHLPPATYSCVLLYIAGAHHLEIRSVGIRVNDIVVACDEHVGSAGVGSHNHDNKYDIVVTSPVLIDEASFVASVRSGPDSSGELIFGNFVPYSHAPLPSLVQ